MASPCKKFKTSTEKRHNVDLFDNLNRYKWGWQFSYNQRALHTRALFNDKRCRVLSDLERVKFITTDSNSHEGEGYECKSTGLWYGSLDHFFATLKIYGVKTFENLDTKPFKDSKCWKEIISCLEVSDFTYVRKPKETNHWETKTEGKIIQEKTNELSEEQNYFLMSLEGALKCDMMNGPGKRWLSALFQTIAHCTDEIKWDVEIKGLAPFYHDNTNAVLEVIHGESASLDTQTLLYNAPYSTAVPARSPSSSSLCSSFEETTTDGRVTRRTVLPDFCIMLPDYPGTFPLVIELKPAGMDNEGLNRNLQQMLCKMFFQDVVFGIVITPTVYHVSVIVKKEGELHFVRFSSELTIPEIGGEIKLSLEKFDNLCTVIYRILLWSKKTYCLLETSSDQE